MQSWTNKAIFVAFALILLTLGWHVLRYYTGIPPLTEDAGAIVKGILHLGGS